MATSVIKNLTAYQQVDIPIQFTSGGTAVATDTLRAFRVGGIVILSSAFWALGISNPTSDIVGPRIIGAFGFNDSGKNYIPVIAETDSLIFCLKNANGSADDIRGTDWVTFTGQFSIVYPTDGIVIP